MSRFVVASVSAWVWLVGACADAPRPRSAIRDDAPAPPVTAAPAPIIAPAGAPASSRTSANSSEPPSVQLDTSAPWPTAMNAAPALVRPTLQTFTLGFGAAPSGRLEGTADIANAHSRRDCKKTVSFGTVLPSACPSASEADAAANWVNAYDERAVVDCHRFRRVTLPAVTAASGRARLGDGDAKRLDEQHTVIAGRWLQTTEYRFPRSTSDDANDSVSPGNVRRNEEAFVVDPEGVVHLAVFVPREERSVDRTACTCACPQCQQQPGGGVPGAYRTIDSQTWYAVPTGTPLGPAVRFAVDVVRAHVARPSNCYGCLCQPPA